MKCARCSKVIPDGFAECPWCGASPSAISSAPVAVTAPIAAAAPRVVAAPSGSLRGDGNTALAWISSSLSLFLVLFAAQRLTMQKFGMVSLEDVGYFLGVFLGPYAAAAILVLAYFWLRRKHPHYSSKLLAISCGASLFAVLSLALTIQTPVSRMVRASARSVAPAPTTPIAPPRRAAGVWDPAVRATFKDIQSFNDQYLAEISKLDSSALPLYTAESFRDAATIRQMLEQLHARLAVAEKFSNPDASLDKLKEYAAATNASDAERRRFLAAFTPPMEKGLQLRKIAAGREREWLLASIDLYKFAEANQSSYTVRDGKVAFSSKGLAPEFNLRHQKAVRLRTEFVRAQQNFLNGQSYLLAQLGLRPSDLDAPAPTPASSPSKQ